MTAPAPAPAVTDPSTQPVPRRRIAAVDSVRGIALLGMMAVHALSGYDAAGDPTVVYSLSAGRSAAVFAVMAGVGIAFLTGRERVRWGRPAGASAATLAARAAVIGAIGLALGYTDAAIAAVILPYYAVLFLLAIPLVLLGARAIAAVGVAIALGMPVLSHLVRDALPIPRLGNPSFRYLVDDPLGLLTELSLTGYYPALPWAAYVCAGLVLGRLDLGSTRVAGGLLGVGAALAAAGSLASWLLLGPLGGQAALDAAGTNSVALPTDEVPASSGEDIAPATTWWWLATDAPHTATPPDLLHTTGVAVTLLGALLLLGHVTAPAARRVITALLGPLAAAGSMILTLYTVHVVFLSSPLHVFSPLAGYLVQVAAALLFALGWRQAVGRGPLESLARWASRRAQRAVTEPARST